ncbi:bone morphogenetic protein 1-like [Branchiostoma floridae x Branchiostoma belcheri]
MAVKAVETTTFLKLSTDGTDGFNGDYPSDDSSSFSDNYEDDSLDQITQGNAAGCGGNLTTPTGGPVTSPNYPSNYGNDENCEWLITAPEGSIIRLTFGSFNTEENYDFLDIYDGASDSAAVIQRLTGQQSVSPVISTSNSMFLRFTSDDIYTRQGFQFSYTRGTSFCSDPGVPANGNRDKNSDYTSGQTVRFTCKTGYQLWGPANITCQANSTWSGATPTCEGNRN